MGIIRDILEGPILREKLESKEDELKRLWAKSFRQEKYRKSQEEEIKVLVEALQKRKRTIEGLQATIVGLNKKATLTQKRMETLFIRLEETLGKEAVDKAWKQVQVAPKASFLKE